MSESLSFDRAAQYYDATRTTDADALAAILKLLTEELEGPVLEIGVGTGQVALPVAASGCDVIGLDISAEMMAQLRVKPGGEGVPLVQGDATRLPFRDGSFCGAYARWVLHLIPNWERVLDELIRVAAPSAAVAIEPGGASGPYSSIMARYDDLLGEVMRLPGLPLVGRDELIDRAMADRGWVCVRTEPVIYDRGGSLEEFFEQIPRRTASWTWNVPEGELLVATAQVREWAAGRWRLDEPQAPVPTTWNVFRASRA